MPGPALDSTLGGIFVALVISAALWGVSCSQTSQYYATRHNDQMWLRALVAIVWAADTAHQAIITQSFYEYVITHFGEFEFLEAVPRTSAVQIILTQLIGTLVQGFYAYKIWKLSEGTLYMVATVGMLLISELAVAIGNAIVDVESSTWTALLRNSHGVSIAYSVLACAVDIVITVMMVYLLQRNRTEISNTRGIINRVTTLILATNFLTTMCSTTMLIITIAAPEKLAIIPLFHVDTKLYAVSFLAALNMRGYLAHGRADSQFVFDMSSFRAGTGTRPSDSRGAPRAAPSTTKTLEPWCARVSADGRESHFTDRDPA